MSKYKSEYTQWFWSECDELNSDTSFANRLAEKAWNYKQAEIDELRKRIDEAIDYLHDGNQRELSYEYADAINDVIDILKGTTNEQ